MKKHLASAVQDFVKAKLKTPLKCTGKLRTLQETVDKMTHFHTSQMFVLPPCSMSMNSLRHFILSFILWSIQKVHMKIWLFLWERKETFCFIWYLLSFYHTNFLKNGQLRQNLSRWRTRGFGLAKIIGPGEKYFLKCKHPGARKRLCARYDLLRFGLFAFCFMGDFGGSGAI